MFGKKKVNVAQQRIDSLVGAETSIHGNIDFAGGLRIDGQVTGNISVAGSNGNEDSTLVLSEKAKVVGEVRVAHVVINGTVDGPVFATEYLELLANARVTGDVHYKTLEMHVGAVVEGRLFHLNNAQNGAES